MRPSTSPRSRRGSYATITAVSLTVLLGFGALAIDVSHVHLVGQQLQTVADASAHGAVMMLDGTDDGMAAAELAATELASLNYAGGKTVTVDGTTSPYAKVSFGVWDAEERVFVESGVAEEVNAVRVTTGHDNTSTAMLGSLTDIALAPNASTTAVRSLPGAGASDCFLPFAVASCLIEDTYGVEGIQDVNLVLNPAGVDNVGWARPGGSPSASWLSAQLGDCESDGEVSVGDSIGLQTGVVTSVLVDMASELELSATTWDSDVWGSLPSQDANSGVAASSYGGTLEGVFMVFDDDAYCQSGGGSFTGTATVSALVWGSVYDVVTKGAAEDKNIKVRLDTSREHELGTSAGGPDWGVQAVAINLAE